MEDGREGAKEEEGWGIGVVWQEIYCALEEEQGVVNDIDSIVRYVLSSIVVPKVFIW